jgi:hypothetical protein
MQFMSSGLMPVFPRVLPKFHRTIYFLKGGFELQVAGKTSMFLSRVTRLKWRESILMFLPFTCDLRLRNRPGKKTLFGGIVSILLEEDDNDDA